MADDLEIEGTGDEDDEMGAAARSFKGRNRFDPCILRSCIKAYDWRNGAPNPAVGLSGPAVHKGRITFFTPAPSEDGLLTFKEGGVAPFDFTAYAIRLAFRFPFETTLRPVADKTGAPVYPYAAAVTPRGVQLAQVIARGLFNLKVDKIPVCEDQPCDAIGGASGLVVQGAPLVGMAENMGSNRKDQWPLPEPIEMSSQGPRLEGWIDLQESDLSYLGEKSGDGIGEPWGDDWFWGLISGDPSYMGLKKVPALPAELCLEFWGRRGLNIKAGTIPGGPVAKR